MCLLQVVDEFMVDLQLDPESVFLAQGVCMCVCVCMRVCTCILATMQGVCVYVFVLYTGVNVWVDG